MPRERAVYSSRAPARADRRPARLAVVPEPPPIEAKVRAAVAEGARSWAEVGRRCGCSRAWASQLGRKLGLQPAGAGPTRGAVLSVRVRQAALDQLDKLAAAEGVERSEMARRLLSEALRARLKRG